MSNARFAAYILLLAVSTYFPFAIPAVGTMTLDEMEASMIRKAIAFYDGNISKVARALGLSRGALYRRMEKYEISEG